MRQRSKHGWFSLALCLLACDEPPAQEERPSFETPDGGADAGAPRTGPQFAVLSSDFSASSISLLDVDGHVLADDYLTSGSTQAGLVTTLSGDVELPTRSGEPGVLVVLDRFKSDVITRIRLSDAKILGQVKTHTPPGQGSESAYSSNPHDYVSIDEHTAWVSRHEPNLDPDVAAIDRGNDLLRIDPAKMTRSDERIDLSVLDATGTRTDPDSGEEEVVPVYARPSAIVRVENMLVVGLARLAFDFSAVGPGMVALVDLQTRKVKGLELPGFANCTGASYVPDNAQRVLVACSGFYADGPRATAGLALLELDGTKARILESWHAEDHPEAPAFGGGVSLGGTQVATTASDFTGSASDVLAVLDLRTGKYTSLFENSPGSGSLGLPYFDAATGLLLVPDASVDGDLRPNAGVRRFVRQPDGSFEQLDVVRVSVDTAMPARRVYPI